MAYKPRKPSVRKPFNPRSALYGLAPRPNTRRQTIQGSTK